MQSHFLIALLLVSFISYTFAVTDENICDVQCDFCCREKTCRSEEECKGNFSPFIILGAVAGGLVGLLVLRKLYVYMKGKNPQPREGAGKRQPRSRSKNTRPKKESKSSNKSSSKSSSKSRPKEQKPEKKEEVYLQIDNESIVSINKPDQELNKTSSLLPEKKNNSKGEISSKSRLEAEDKSNTQRSEKKRESSAPRSKTPNKTSNSTSKPGTSSSKQPSKKPATGAKSGSSKPGTSGDRGRSGNSSGKDRASSQPKKSGASGTTADKSKTVKKNQV